MTVEAWPSSAASGKTHLSTTTVSPRRGPAAAPRTAPARSRIAASTGLWGVAVFATDPAVPWSRRLASSPAVITRSRPPGLRPRCSSPGDRSGATWDRVSWSTRSPTIRTEMVRSALAEPGAGPRRRPTPGGAGRGDLRRGSGVAGEPAPPTIGPYRNHAESPADARQPLCGPRRVIATAKHFLRPAGGGCNHGPVQLGIPGAARGVAEPFAAAIRDAGLSSVMNLTRRSTAAVCVVGAHPDRVAARRGSASRQRSWPTTSLGRPAANLPPRRPHQRRSRQPRFPGGHGRRAARARLLRRAATLIEAGISRSASSTPRVRRVLVQEALGLFDDLFVDS